jgi:hypothetical protein
MLSIHQGVSDAAEKEIDWSMRDDAMPQIGAGHLLGASGRPNVAQHEQPGLRVALRR